jgi:cell division protein FtsB
VAADAARAHAPALPAPPRPRRRAATRRAPRLRLAGSVVWIVVLATLLAGVVALNVAVLRLNLQLDGLGAQQARLRAENAELASRAATDASPVRIKAEAAALGYRAVDASEITFVVLDRATR